MANSISSDLNFTVITQSALEAFVSAIAALKAFSTNFSADAVNRNEIIQVPYYPAAAAAQNFAGTYSMQNSTVESKPITINKHKFVSWFLTDTEVANSPVLELERFGRQKGFALAKAVFQDILSIVTDANFGTAAFTGAASGFDSDDVSDIRLKCNQADMPDMMRSLIVAADYDGALTKDSSIKSALNFGSNQVITTGRVPNILGFDYYWSNLIPANGENLVGMAVYPSAILVAMRYLQPQEGNKYSIAESVTDPETGITIGVREWYDEDTGTKKRVLECNYGYSKGEAAALKRLVSA